MEEINKKLNLIDFYEKKYRDVKLYGEDDLNFLRKKYKGLKEHKKSLSGIDAIEGLNYESSSVFYNDDNFNNRVIAKLSSEVIKMLKLTEGKLSICGPAVSGAVYKNDVVEYDLYFHNVNHEEAEKLFQGCMKCLNNYSGVHTKLTMRFSAGNSVFNFHRTVYEDKSHIFLETDLDIYQVGFNLVNGLFGSIHGILGLALNKFPLRFYNYSPVFGRNLEKCLEQGFTASTIVDFYDLHDEVSKYEFDPEDSEAEYDLDDTFENGDGYFHFASGSFISWFGLLQQSEWSGVSIMESLIRGWYNYIPFIGNDIEKLSFDTTAEEIKLYHSQFKVNENNKDEVGFTEYYRRLNMVLGSDYQRYFQEKENPIAITNILEGRCKIHINKLKQIFVVIKSQKWLAPKFKRSKMNDATWYQEYYEFYEPELFGIDDEEYVALRGLPILKEVIGDICKFRLRNLAYEAADGLF